MLASSLIFTLFATSLVSALPFPLQQIRKELPLAKRDISPRCSKTKRTGTALFPAGQPSDSWSTSQSAMNHVPLSTSALQATEILDLPHPVTAAPDGKMGMQAHFPQGSYDLQNGGLSFYAPGPDSVHLTTAKEATFSYRVFFEEGFDWNKGGKLPGFYGGDSDAISKTCSGGHKPNGCFSTRMMWRRDAMGELYAYLPPGYEANHGVCDIPPFSTCNPDYGSSVGRGAFHFAAGAWTTVSQRVRLNDPGAANGQVEIFVNGESVISADGLVLRDNAEGRIRGCQIQAFFGGHDETWASPRDQNLWFSDFSVAIIEQL